MPPERQPRTISNAPPGEAHSGSVSAGVADGLDPSLALAATVSLEITCDDWEAASQTARASQPDTGRRFPVQAHTDPTREIEAMPRASRLAKLPVVTYSVPADPSSSVIAVVIPLTTPFSRRML
jgi:hypothetical protein